MKKKSNKKQKGQTNDLPKNCEIPLVHDFNESEVEAVRSSLLSWYDDNRRDLPWRSRAISTEDPNQRAYAVWVSEIMLQQTQVATVIDYYNKWMAKWLTLEDLAKATLEEVNTMWAGLGYYSRGRRLLEGAKKVVEELDGKMPDTAEDLVKQLPGVGRYTAGAIASIACNQVTGLVDGNVVRVLCRMRMMGADSTSQPVQDTLWSHANKLVDVERPGDFNQSLMELGATVCTPKTPSCSECPVRWHCKAYAQVEYEKKAAVAKWTKTKVTDEDNNIPDIECAAENCKLCIPGTEEWDPSEGVLNYPRKPRKKAPREETTSVCLVCCHHSDHSKRKFLVLKRKDNGLLSGLWEFPSLKCESGEREEAEVWLQTHYSLCLPADTQLQHIGQVVHNFSHITQTYVVDCLVLTEVIEPGDRGDNSEWKWLTGQEFLSSAISTAMKKVFRAFERSGETLPIKVVHNFSHITQTYVVDCLVLTEVIEPGDRGDNSEWKWLTGQEFLSSAISTAMKKVFRAFERSGETLPIKTNKRKRDSPTVSKDGKKQASLHSFFKSK